MPSRCVTSVVAITFAVSKGAFGQTIPSTIPSLPPQPSIGQIIKDAEAATGTQAPLTPGQVVQAAARAATTLGPSTTSPLVVAVAAPTPEPPLVTAAAPTVPPAVATGDVVVVAAPTPEPPLVTATAPTVPPATAQTVHSIAAPKLPPVTAPTVPPAIAPTVHSTAAPTVPPATAPTVPPVTAPKVHSIAAPTVPPITAPTVPPVTAPKLHPVTTPTVPPAVAAAAKAQCSKVGVAINDGDHNKTVSGYFDTPRECQIQCQKTPTCSHFTYYNNSRGCWLQGKNISYFMAQYATSGPAKCSLDTGPDSVPKCATVGTALNDELRNTTLNGKIMPSAAACQEECKNETFCEHFTYYTSSGGCWLQGNNVSSFASVHAISGPAVCEPEPKPAAVVLPVPVAQDATPAPAQDNTANQGGFPIWGYILIVVGVLGLLAGCYALFCGRAKKGVTKKKVSGKPEKAIGEDVESQPLMQQPVRSKPSVAPVSSTSTSSSRITNPAAVSSIPTPITTSYVTSPSPAQVASSPVTYSSPTSMTSNVYTTSAAAPISLVAAPAQSATRPMYSAPVSVGAAMPARTVQYQQQDMFSALDANGDGVLTREEMARMNIR